MGRSTAFLLTSPTNPHKITSTVPPSNQADSFTERIIFPTNLNSARIVTCPFMQEVALTTFGLEAGAYELLRQTFES